MRVKVTRKLERLLCCGSATLAAQRGAPSTGVEGLPSQMDHPHDTDQRQMFKLEVTGERGSLLSKPGERR